MKEREKLKETLEKIHELAEESILYLPKLESLGHEEKDPLIKDEKVRKAVRAWAEMNDIRFIHMCSRTRKENARIAGRKGGLKSRRGKSKKVEGKR